MTNSSTFNETRQLAEGLSGCVFNRLVTSKTESSSFEAWVATLAMFVDEPERETRAQQDAATDEIKPPLQKLAAGPWRSLGGYFDYSLWPDRERFLELNKAIAAGQEGRETISERDVEYRLCDSL